MQIQLFFLSLICFYTNALFNNNLTNSSFTIELHQCHTNQTIINHTTIIMNKNFSSCTVNCCKKNDTNICQVTVQSSTNTCLSRLCYSGECDQFLSETNSSVYQKYTSPIPWSSYVNSIKITWPSWRDKSFISIRYSILILLLIANFSLTLITLFIVIKAIRHAKMIAERKSRRYSLF